MSPMQTMRPIPGNKFKQKPVSPETDFSGSVGKLNRLTQRHLKSTELLGKQINGLTAPPTLNLDEFTKHGSAVGEQVAIGSSPIAPIFPAEADAIETYIVRSLDAFRDRARSFVDGLVASFMAIVGMKRGMHAGSVEAISQLRALSRVYISECRSPEDLAVLERVIAESYFGLLFAAHAHKTGALGETKAFDRYQGTINRFILRWKKNRR